MPQCDDRNVEQFMKFIFEAPEDQVIASMDCNDHCEDLARLAEEVAAGKDVGDVLPALERYMEYWTDCREEFEALVAILRAEQSGELEAPDSVD
jgi:hypothetical protein